MREDAPSPCEDWEQDYELRDVTHRAAREMSENPNVEWSFFPKDEIRFYVKDYRPQEFTCADCGETFAIKNEGSRNLCISCWCEGSKKAWAEHPEGITIDLREGKNG